MPIISKAYAAKAKDKPLGQKTIKRRDPGGKDVVVDILY